MAKKYIDAEVLKAEIQRLKDEYTDIAIDSQRGWVNANSVIDDLEQLQSLIDSLQKEQLEKKKEKVCGTCVCWQEGYLDRGICFEDKPLPKHSADTCENWKGED